MELRPYYDPNSFRSPSGPPRHIKYGPKNDDGPDPSSPLNSSSPLISAQKHSGFDYIDGELGDSISGAAAGLLRLYGRVFISQPSEVSRLLLQVGQWDVNEPGTVTRAGTGAGRQEGQSDTTAVRDSNAGDASDSESDEEVDYFVSEEAEDGKAWRTEAKNRAKKEKATEKAKAKALAKKSSTNKSGPRKSGSKGGSDHLLRIISTHFIDVITSLNEKDGFRGLWRALNTSFILEASQSTIEAWLSGFLSSIARIPDPHFVAVLGSPSPGTSLTVAVCATVGAALVLSPLDVLRTRLAVTTIDSGPRSIRSLLVTQKRYSSPFSVLVPTAFYSGIPAIISKGTPYYIYTRLRIDSYSSPSLYSLLSLASTVFELTVKLPLETILRRAQVAALNLDPSQLIVVPFPYESTISTVWDVLLGKYGIDTLFRGWRVSLAGALGDWGVRAIQGAQKDSGTYPSKERF